MDRLYKLFSPRPDRGMIGIWDCQGCGGPHDASESWVLVGVGADERGAHILCADCAAATEADDR